MSTLNKNTHNHIDLTKDILCYPKGDRALLPPLRIIFKHFMNSSVHEQNQHQVKT